MNFKIFDNNKIINCKIIMTFRDENNDVNYIIYTDGTKDENLELEIYASRYIIENDEYILKPIENDYEWDLIDNMLENKSKESE